MHCPWPWCAALTYSTALGAGCQAGRWGGLEVLEGWQQPGPPKGATQWGCWLAGPCVPDTSGDGCSLVVPLHCEPPREMTQCRNASPLSCHQECFSSAMREGSARVRHWGHEGMHKPQPPYPSLILAHPLDWGVVRWDTQKQCRWAPLQ